jgi:hypothetical protein
MTVRSHIETAEESIRQAIINCLAEKNDTSLSQLFDILNKIKTALYCFPESDTTSRSEFTFSSSQDYWYEDGISVTGNPGTASSDTISFSNPNLNTNVITFGSSTEDKVCLGLD